MAKIKEYFNPNIAGRRYQGFIKAVNTIEDFGSVWYNGLGEAGIDALDNFIKLKIGEREMFKPIGELGEASTYINIANIMMAYNYQLDGLFNLLIPNDGSIDGYNPLDNVNEIRHEETDIDFDKGEDTIKFEKGEDTIKFEKGEDTVKFEKGSDSTKFVKGSDSTKFVKGEDSVTLNKGSDTITVELDNRKTVTKNPERTDEQTSSQTTTAFDTLDYGKATDKDITSMKYDAFDVETDTDSTTDKTTNSSRTDTTTNSTREDNTTNSSREDNTTNSAREDNTTNSAREDNTTNSARHDDTKTIYDVRRHGNIGVTTSFDLIAGDRKLHYYTFFQDVVDVLINEILSSCLWEV